MGKLLALVLLITACFGPKPNEVIHGMPIKIEYVDLPSYGMTHCDTITNQITIYIDKNQTQDQKNWTTVHELTHAGQIMGLGTCKNANLRYDTDREYRFRAELDAYCSEARTQEIVGIEVIPLDSVIPFDMYMFLAYGRAFGDLDSTRSLIKKYCPILVPYEKDSLDPAASVRMWH